MQSLCFSHGVELSVLYRPHVVFEVVEELVGE